MDEYVKEPIYARIIISYQKDDIYVYQTIHIIPSKPIYLKYFILEKYKVGRIVHDLLQTLYIGDGDNIMFESRKTFKNATIIKYRIDSDIPINLSSQEYHIDGFRPKFDGCDGCDHFIKSKKGADRCKFYKSFLSKYKKSCQDFLEKGV